MGLKAFVPFTASLPPVLVLVLGRGRMLERPTWNEYVDMNVLGCTIAIVDLV